MTMELSIVIVNWNTCDLLAGCLDSIYTNPPAFPFEIWVVDNASTDGSLQMLQERFPGVNRIANQENLGFARANNLAIKQASGRLVLLLNSDTLVEENTLTKMLEFMQQHAEVGALGVKLVNPDGSFQASYAKFPTLLSEFLLIAGLAQRVIGRYAPSPAPRAAEAPQPVDWIIGAVILIRQEVIQKAGMFREDFFLYSEETDWCWRIWKSGASVWYLPDVSVIHFGGSSSRKSSIKSYAQLYKSKVLFFELNYGKTQAKMLKWTFRTVLSIRYQVWRILKGMGLKSLRGVALERRIEHEKFTLSAL